MVRADKWMCMALLALVACGETNPTSSNGGVVITPRPVTGGDGNGNGNGSTAEDPNNPGNGGNAGSNGGDIGGGANPGGGTSGNSDNPICGSLIVRARPVAPDMLIVLDRSGSMTPRFNATMTDRWNPSVAALKQVTEELQHVIHFGLMTFPAKSAMGGTTCAAPGGLDVPIEGGNAAQIATALDNATPDIGQTPTDLAMKEALNVLGSALSTPDEVTTPKYVLLVTDGEPSCRAGVVEQTRIAATKQAIEALYDQGIKTYVVGYDVPAAAGVMNDFAMSGGTDKYIPVDSGDTLLEELRKIAGQLAPCEYVLDEEPEDPIYVYVEIDSKPRPLNDPDGFTVDGKVIRLGGASCAEVQDGREHAIRIEVQCEPVHIL
jgi:hypothetical protein